MKIKMNSKITTGIIVLAGFAIGSGIVAVASPLLNLEQPRLYADANHSIVAEFDSPEFGINARGETYGSASGVGFEGMPDLISAVGDCGAYGYIRKSESPVSDIPSSPEEAMRRQEESERYGVQPRAQFI